MLLTLPLQMRLPLFKRFRCSHCVHKGIPRIREAGASLLATCRLPIDWQRCLQQLRCQCRSRRQTLAAAPAVAMAPARLSIALLLELDFIVMELLPPAS